MCCNKRRGCAVSGSNRRNRPQQSADMASLKRMVNQLSLELHPHERALELQQTPRTHESGFADENLSEQLPSYDVAMSTPVTNGGLDSPVAYHNNLDKPASKGGFSHAHSADNNVTTSNVNSQAIAQSYDRFQQALTSYRDDGCCGRFAAMRAARALVKDLCEDEIARRRLERGYPECGERYSIKRELRPLKEELKDSVRAIKREQRNRRCCNC